MLQKFLLLLLSSPICAVAQSATDYYVKSLPGQPDGPFLKMHAGHVEVDPETNGNLFFWHFENRHIANRQRTVLWLNGGPGCSSMDGALMEIGPYRLQDDHTLVNNNGSWNEFANLLFVDQPVGTGFSYVNTNSYIHDLDQMATHMITFLEKWFALFPEYQTDDLYLAGESYAGQYIPYIAKAIVDRNKKGTDTPWSLKGVMIGNGWISPLDQYPAYLQYAYAEGLIKKDSDISSRLEELQNVCSTHMSDPEAKNRVDIPECEGVLSQLLTLTSEGGKCTNMYDVRLREDDTCGSSWPPDLASMTPYLRRPDVAEALNLNHDKSTGWQECADKVGVNFRAGHSVPSIQILPEIIESGVRVLLFSGDKDLICNHLGTEQLIHNMKWDGGAGFETSPGIWAPRRGWTFDDEPAGYYQQARNLTYILFYNASHMVPFDWPRRSRDMLDRFINVNITSIGGSPGDSRLDGEKLPETTVGGHQNETTSTEDEDEKLKDAEWKAYTKSGEAALIVVIIGVSVWGYLIYRSRRQHHGYSSVYRGALSPGGSSTILNRFRKDERPGDRDLEATDFDESELDRLNRSPNMAPEHYIIDDDDEPETSHGGAHSQGK